MPGAAIPQSLGTVVLQNADGFATKDILEAEIGTDLGFWVAAVQFTFIGGAVASRHIPSAQIRVEIGCVV